VMYEWFQQLPGCLPVWFSHLAANGPLIALSSRVRLARNVADLPFPGRLDQDRKTKLYENLSKVLGQALGEEKATVIQMSDIDRMGCDILLERHLISRELFASGEGSGLVMTEDMSAMINEEDHIRLQVVRPGISLQHAWERISTFDSSLASELKFTFDTRLGFLTACPSNVGTGLRASVMLHLPGLNLRGQMEAIGNGLGRLGFALRGAFGEGSEAVGNLFQISNQSTLGESEDSIISRLLQIIADVVRYEECARKHLLLKEVRRLSDHVGRAYGMLRHARILTSSDALEGWSALWLGVEAGLFSHFDARVLTDLFMPLQPGHLQLRLGVSLSAEARDTARADMVRGVLHTWEKRVVN